ATVTLQEPDKLNYTIETYGVSMPGASDGAVDLSISGGVPGYNYAWSNGSPQQDLNNVEVGTYTFTVYDSYGCEVEGEAVVDYLCNPMLEMPYDEGFETDMGDWRPLPTGDFDWMRHTDGTPTALTGPENAAEGDFYLYAEADGHANQLALIQSPCFDLMQSSAPKMTFDYHLFGDQMGQLQLRITENAGGSWEQILNVNGDQGTDWQTVTIDLTPYVGKVVSFLFVAKIGGERSDIAIDMFQIEDPAGPTGVNPDLDLETPTFSLYPNPVSELLNIELNTPGSTAYNWQMIDAMGRILQQGEQLTAHQQIAVDRLPAGVYWLRVFNEGQERVERFVAQR
ncbi:MAG: T9SS type A sorting domain-containing protein, partial [Phaeodactylibacter sp.]|nr:T9SS type A sorting domain-containing protein [Phaeodactylibacter sp.]